MGTLYIVSTPIGNLADITIRAIKTLFSVDIILCEDTRRTGILLQELKKRYGYILQQSAGVTHHSRSQSCSNSGNEKLEQTCVSPELIRFDATCENQKIPEVIGQLQQGESLALVSDAGTPLISDPGYVLVREARKRGVHVVSIPGASAILTALTSSGLPPDKFIFLGYPPEKQSARMKQLNILQSINRLIDVSYIFYCAPHKLTQTLEDMKSVLGDINIVIARELTKVHEEIWRGRISESLRSFSSIRGEIVLLINF